MLAERERPARKRGVRIMPGRYNDQIRRFILQNFVGIGYTRLEAELLSNIARRQAGGRRDRGDNRSNYCLYRTKP